MGTFYLDILARVGNVDYESAKGDAFIEKIENVEIPVAGLDAMIRLKPNYRKIDKKTNSFLSVKKNI